MRAREKQVRVRMTEEEYKAYQKRLEKSKLTGNEYGLRCLLNQPINVIPNMTEILKELRPIGNNLNQIARAANGGYTAAPAIVAELERQVDELRQLLKLPREVSRRHRSIK